LWLDAVYLKVRQNHRIVSMAVVIAIGVRDAGTREVLGLAVGASEEAAFWQAFLRSLVQRGLKGVRLVISDAHTGLRTAVGQVLSGASWQRCRVHFMRNLLAHIPHGDKSMVAAAVRTIFAQPDREAAGQQLDLVVQNMAKRWPKAAALLAEAEEEVLAYRAFPREHWTRIYSTNTLERLNKEVKRRVDVVGIFPDVASVERRYFSLESMKQLLQPESPSLTEPMAMRLAPIH
jgi:putative transposase